MKKILANTVLIFVFLELNAAIWYVADIQGLLAVYFLFGTIISVAWALDTLTD